jgi:Icc-related predicted phosphoesterase
MGWSGQEIWVRNTKEKKRPTMSILFISDLHYELGYHHTTFEEPAFNWLLKVVNRVEPTALIGLGDWGYAWGMEEWNRLLGMVPVHAIYGNHDILSVLCSVKNNDGTKVNPRDGEIRKIDGLRLGFINGIMSDTKPFKDGVPRKKPKEYVRIAKTMKGKIDVLCTHESPMIPEYEKRLHPPMIGVLTMRKIIEDLQPKYAFSGHISGPFSMAIIGKTWNIRVDSSQDEKHFAILKPKVDEVEVWDEPKSLKVNT